MSKAPHRPRPSLPASSTDFALRASSSALQSPSDEFTGLNPLLFRFRRPSLLAPKYISESRLSSPLSTSFSSPLRPSSTSDIDRERIWADSGSTSESSENATPPLNGSEADKDVGTDSDSAMKTSRPQTPPPRNLSSSSMDAIAESSYLPHLRRLSHPLMLPRILNLVRESSRPDESEVKSEAQFQLADATCTPRAPSDRGRYPEEVSEERDIQRCQTPSDDSDYEDPDSIPFAFAPPTQEPITIRTRTPAASVSGSLCGDDPSADSPGAAMDIDAPPSLFGSPAAASLHQWRYTPPPTASSAVRTNDDRFDPYPTSSKRRAVSPSVSFLRENHTSLSPIYIPRSGSSSRGPIPWSVAVCESTMRTSMGLGSPITRPMRMSRRAVNGLSLA
ncbi:hypothetical protein B0F90DRAFT_1807520 [Multifurca ochricompacta]|uniref:Uncharacterized protein n=1 Tax=Multifurca ochricompacta TaxID=376703 RepID=A0AAD4QUJ0_9AGAM|nr:hypothetical protein B0F90DRAFT_1807520 [Multifurca ochricompacta]